MPTLDLSRDEAELLLRLARARHAELERMLRNLEETEGLDATKWSLRRQLEKEIELAQDALLKLEGSGSRP